ncbi:endonuclease [Komagataeibacter oboediens]|uniref:Endonuclease n=2 Tax=Komagataeibacter oboediens TaxID=65958 RepID=A0A318QPB0_9PROT|nr:endonuclease [Komagataeibacter oboediens]
MKPPPGRLFFRGNPMWKGMPVLAIASTIIFLTGPAQAGCYSDPTPQIVNAKMQAGTTFLCNGHYSVLYSSITHGPLWSAERLTSENVRLAAGIQRQGQFQPDPRLPYDQDATLEDYRRSGFDRGHMTPSGDEPDRQTQAQTFYLSNIVPQTPALNRGIWAGVEMAVRDLALQVGELLIVTGPGYDAEIDTIGPDHVFVPAFTWKAVYLPTKKGGGAYVCANVNERPACFVESLAALTVQVGIDPFPQVAAASKKQVFPLPKPEHSPYTPDGVVSEDIGEMKEALRDWLRQWTRPSR